MQIVPLEVYLRGQDGRKDLLGNPQAVRLRLGAAGTPLLLPGMPRGTQEGVNMALHRTAGGGTGNGA